MELDRNFATCRLVLLEIFLLAAACQKFLKVAGQDKAEKEGGIFRKYDDRQVSSG